MKISVIMPVYNSEKTLGQAVSAVLAQELLSFELLICDDGSSDRSREIAQGFAESDDRVKLLECPHRGVSAARNSALAKATGDYIAFVDSDDIPQPGWLSTLAGHACRDGLSVCGYSVVDAEGNYLYDSASRGNAELDVILSPRQYIMDIFSNRMMYQGYVWNKLFSRELMEMGKPLRFDEGVACNEDRLFLLEYLLRCGTVFCASDVQYSYVSRQRSGYRHPMLSELRAFGKMFSKLRREKMLRALHYAEKDSFRAAAELLCAALKSESPDMPYLTRYVLRRVKYVSEFEEYPQSAKDIFFTAAALAMRYRRRRMKHSGRKAYHGEI